MDAFPLLPPRTALINVDVQRCFVEGSPLAAPDGCDLVHRINGLIGACREVGATVVHTRVWMKADGSDLGVMAELVPPFIIELYTEQRESAKLHDDLDVAPDDIVVDKTRYGAFHRTGLERQLRDRGIDTVIISGIATNICCETTAREAAQLDFRVVFLSDGTATMDMNGVPAHELQRATLASVGQVFGQIATIDEVVERIRDSARATDGADRVGV